MFLFLYILLYDVILLLHRALYTWCSQNLFCFFLFFSKLFVCFLFEFPPSPPSILFPRKTLILLLLLLLSVDSFVPSDLYHACLVYNIISFHRQAPRRSSIDHDIICIFVLFNWPLSTFSKDYPGRQPIFWFKFTQKNKTVRGRRKITVFYYPLVVVVVAETALLNIHSCIIRADVFILLGYIVATI